ncbi:MAG TPA: hypothetical protein VIF83_04645, partial [Gemmatimonadaceae bacterium]
RTRVELTPELVSQLVARVFSAKDQATALEMLDSYGAAAHEREPVRVRVALLKLSNGKLSELEHLIAHARQDYRDVLAWAEFPQELEQPTWQMPADRVAQIRGADRAQYLEWLKAHTSL